MSDDNFRVDIIFGTVKLETRTRWDGERGYGEGRKTEFDLAGNITHQSEWEPTGATIVQGSAIRSSLIGRTCAYFAELIFR